MVHVDVEFCIFVDNFECELNIWLLKSRFITKEQLAFIFSFIVIFTFWIRLETWCNVKFSKSLLKFNLIPMSQTKIQM